MEKHDPEAVEAVANAYRDAWCAKVGIPQPFPPWSGDSLEGKEYWRDHAVIALDALASIGRLVPVRQAAGR